MSRRVRKDDAIMNTLLLAVIGTAPLSTSEVAWTAKQHLLATTNAPLGIGGPQIALPYRGKCHHCGLEHECVHLWPVSSGLLKPYLERLAKSGAIKKTGRGNARPALWSAVEVAVSDEDLDKVLGR